MGPGSPRPPREVLHGKPPASAKPRPGGASVGIAATICSNLTRERSPARHCRALSPYVMEATTSVPAEVTGADGGAGGGRAMASAAAQSCSGDPEDL